MRRIFILLSAILAAAACSADIDLSFQPAKVYGNDEYAFAIVSADGSWTLSSDSQWVSISPSSGSGSKANVILSFDTNETGSDRSASITLSCGRAKVSRSFVQMSEVSAGQGGSPSGVTGFRCNGIPADIKWMELPAGDLSTDFVAHYFTYNNRTMRNFSLSWSTAHNVALWVAYPLGGSYLDKKNVGRTNSWAADPDLGGDSPLPTKPDDEYPLGGNYCSGWTRGHQIPSYDRQCCREANEQTFYGSNITPQNYNFNSGIWLSLENKVRDWAGKSDTLYVVTGCVVPDGTSRAPFKDGKTRSVSIPKAYWKALLRYQKNSSIGYAGYAGCAIWLDHEGHPANEAISSKYSMSIDALESRLGGIDLFVNLPGAVGKSIADKVEAQSPTDNGWWFK